MSVVCRTKKEGSTKKGGGSNVVCFDKNGLLNGNKNIATNKMPEGDDKAYMKITLAGLNEIMVKLDIRKATTVSPNSGGTKAKKIEKILAKEGGRMLLKRKLLIGKTQTEDQSAQAVADANKKAKAKASLKKNPFNTASAKEKAKADLIKGSNSKLVNYKVPRVTVKASQIASANKLGKPLPKDKSGFLKVKSVKITRAGGKYNKK